MSFIIVYITYPNEETATKLSNYLVENKYVACSNIFPMKSAYWWEGAISSEDEFVSIIKTIPQNWPAIQIAIEKLHPYEVPCIMKINVEANEAYENWIQAAVELKI